MLSVGDYTYGTNNIIIHRFSGTDTVKVGKFCSIASNCNIFLGANHRTDWITTYPFGVMHKKIFDNFDGTGVATGKGGVVIGNDVWLAANVTIMGGVQIGDGAVVANNSHVVKDVPPYSIVGGNPARIIKYRFNPDEIAKLQQIRWWDWPIEQINVHLPLLCANNLTAFFTKIESKLSKIFYGANYHYVDVTAKAAQCCTLRDKIVLPKTDGQRAALFGDDLPGILKHLKLVNSDGIETTVACGTEYSIALKDCQLDLLDTIFSPPRVYKYRLAIVCLFKNATFYLKEWLAFHKVVGVEHFWLCDNGSTDDYHSILAPYLARGEVTLSHMSPVPNTCDNFDAKIRLPFFNRIISDTRDQVEWLACLNCDEFLVPPKCSTVLEALNKYADYHCVQVSQQLYGTSNIAKLGKDDLLIESLVWKSSAKFSYKMICRPQYCWFVDTLHSMTCRDPKKTTQADIDDLRLNCYIMGDEYHFNSTKMPFVDKPCDNAFHDVKDPVIHRFMSLVSAVLENNAVTR